MAKRNRGRRKLNISDLIGQWPTSGELNDLIDHVADHKQHSIAIAILGAAVLEYDLERILRPKFRRSDDTTWARLTGENGPLNSLAQKINIAYAFGLFSDQIRKNLTVVKTVRNVFAHSKKLIEFENEIIVSALAEIVVDKARRNYPNTTLKIAIAESTPPKATFILLCLTLTNVLTKIANRPLKSKNAYLRRKLKRITGTPVSPLLQAFLQSSSEGGSQGLGAFQSANPKARALGLALLSSTGQPKPSAGGKTEK